MPVLGLHSQAWGGTATSCGAAGQGWVPWAPVLSHMDLAPSRAGSSCASPVLSLSHQGEKRKNSTKAGGLQQGMGVWEFLQQCVPGMEMSGTAADQKCDPRVAAEKVLSSRLRRLSAPTLTGEVSTKANQLHFDGGCLV